MKYKRTRLTLSRWQVELYITLHIDSFKTTLYTSDMYMNRLVVKGTSELEMEFVKIGTNNVKEITQQYEMLFSCTHWMLCIKEHHHAMQSSFHQMLQLSLWSNWAGKHELWESTTRSICPTLGNILTRTNCEDIFVLNIFLRGLKVAHVNLMCAKI